MKGVGSISRKIDTAVVWGLFNKHSRRNRERRGTRRIGTKRRSRMMQRLY